MYRQPIAPAIELTSDVLLVPAGPKKIAERGEFLPIRGRSGSRWSSPLALPTVHCPILGSLAELAIDTGLMNMLHSLSERFGHDHTLARSRTFFLASLRFGDACL